MMTRKLFPLAVAALVAAVISVPVHLLADVASCSLATSSYADAVINPPRGEDTEFFVSTGGVPNLMFLIDTSGSMMNMAPDGARDTWGSFERPGNLIGGGGFGCSNSFANARVYSSPCGTTTIEGSAYNPTPGVANPNDYFEAKDSKGNYCPHMVSGNQPPASNKPGFDPDFPAFFPRDRVIRDRSWDINGPSPEAEANVAGFCSRATFSAAQQASCSTCMRDRGYWFDGSYPTASSRRCATSDDCALHGDGTCLATNSSTGIEYSDSTPGAAKIGYCRLPNVYFSGNFLNFFPPKFLMARKVFKDVLMAVRRVRMGITTFSGSTGGNLLDPLNPGCNMFGSPSAFDSNRGALKNEINNTNRVNFNTVTPLSETLFQVGQYYRSASLPWFNNAYKVAAFEERSGQGKSVCFSCQASAVLVITDGLPNRDGQIPGTDFAPAPMTRAVANTPGSYAGMAGYNIKGISTTDCPSCETWAEMADTAIANGACNGNQDSGACDDSGNPAVSYLPRVAWYLKNLDFRLDTEVGSDGFPFVNKQGLTTYTIGLGTRGAAHEILRHTAEAGGGLFNGGSGAEVVDVRTLKEAIMKVLEDVNTRSTSFGAASFSTLQVASTQGVLVPRFEPARSAHWDGHLYAFDLYSEFTAATGEVPGKVKCVPAAAGSGPGNGDYDCDGKCNSVFLVDRQGAFIQEDGAGAFKKNSDPNLTACGNGSMCASAGVDCSVVGSVAAVPFWDAGSKLAPVKKSVDPATGAITEENNPDFQGARLAWDRRKIFTVIDRTNDGKLTAADMPLVDLRTVAAATMVPYLNIRGSKYCSSLAQRLTSLGNPAGAAIGAELAAGNYTTCARLLLDFTRGADVFNERLGDPACTNYPSVTNPNGTYCTRKYQLGDVFHSSPVEVDPPFGSDAVGGFACPRGIANQCLTALWSPTVPGPSADGFQWAYDDYTQSSRYKNRHKFALVGANDGMLHAIEIEATSPIAGEEIWAFIPPDLLPKLRLLTESTHQFYVDGTPMVRDVWLDGGVLNKLRGGGSRASDGTRQGDEFHTVAVVGERRGGTHYFALDVTEASSDLDSQPRFMWLYPQPNDPEQLSFGETYVDFLPVPPPIGPVRIDQGATPCSGGYQSYSNRAGVSRCFEERYVVMLSGGFDPQYTRGRGVHMVDIATGEEVWDFSQPAGSGATCGAGSDPRCHLNYPVAATVSMLQWGDQEARQLGAQDWYFDTATFGDTGGQLWVLRFAEPGVGFRPGTGGKVTNWFGARVYQNGLGASTPACGLDYCGGQPFFFITANVALNENNFLRTLIASGDRFNLLDPVGGTCGPDNLRACLIKGCTVTLNDGTALSGPGAVYAVETLLGTQSYKMTGTASCAATPVGDFQFASTGGDSSGTCGTITQKVDGLAISCPAELTCSRVAESTFKSAGVKCTADSCDPSTLNDYGTTIDLKGNPDKVNQALSILAFQNSATSPRRIFRTAAEALAYDQARLTDASLKDITQYEVALNPAFLASTDGNGWRYVFPHGETATSGAVTILINGLPYNIYRTDERAASVPNVQFGCGFWNTMQTATPVGATDATTECPINSPCKAGRSQISYLYGADPADGSLCMTLQSGLSRSQRNDTLVPPTMGKQVAYVSGSQVAFGLTSVRVPQGGANVSLGAAQDLTSVIQWLPIDIATHRCRHGTKNADGSTTPPTAADCK